jgi:hypothetical protein
MEHAPGPRGSPQLPHAPELGTEPDALFAETAKTESWGVKALLSHLGQAGLSLANTRASNRWSHCLQTYSKIGMAYTEYTKLATLFYSSDLMFVGLRNCYRTF